MHIFQYNPFSTAFVIITRLSFILSANLDINYNKQLEKELLKGYNSKHRPVKDESTTVQVQVFISITHVEKVDEHEQTMMVHGHLWATWTDEYLIWDPAKYNGTDKINLEAWRIWQPALALYNSARGNAWYLYMNGMPAIIAKDGKVWASGAFSFFVTCRFDFSAWPYDVQDCPIVISDWVYDLARVNLTDPGDSPWKDPQVKLNYDPQTAYEKKHVAGWEVADTWRRHCYWGPNGCRDEIPQGQPEWYWSLLEFGVRIKRHAPYISIIIVFPTIVSCCMNLLAFWVDTSTSAMSLLIVNILVQGIFGWDLIRELPPGSGGIPRVAFLYACNLALTAVSFIVHVIFNHLTTTFPTDFILPFQLDEIPQKLRMIKFFEAKGLSFDPQSLLEDDSIEKNNYHSPIANFPEKTEEHVDDTEHLIPLESAAKTESSSETVNIPIEDTSEPEVISFPKPTPQEAPEPNLERQLYLLRRFLFCIYVFIYMIVIPYGIF